MNTVMPKALQKVMVAPSTVAKNLNRGAGSVLSLNVHRERICITIGSYDSVHKLPDVSTGSLKRDKKGTHLLNQIVEDHNVCGFVVSWPVQKDTGKLGASAGRVLFTLEKIMQQDAKIFTAERPLCFWDSFRTNNERKPVDDLGRCAAYGEASEKSIYFASLEQYNHDENVTSAEVWNDFCKVHLPQVAKRAARTALKRKENLISDWNDSFKEIHPLQF